MTNTDELRSIHAKLIEDNAWSAMSSVKHIAGLLGRTETTVWCWLSAGDGKVSKPIPNHMIRLLKKIV